MTSAVAAIECSGVSKVYDGHAAVVDFNLTVPEGPIHALVGANGAGKSTALGMMSGRTAPTTGTVSAFGQVLHGGRPREAHRAGISSVYQELTLVPKLSACANVFLGAEEKPRGFLSEASMRRRYFELCDVFELKLDPDIPAGNVSVAVGQQLEIMRAVHRGAKLLLLDEPTAALSYRERDHLISLMRRLRDEGVTLIFVSHNLDEVLSVCDDVTVMRNARIVRTVPAREIDKRGLIETMTGTALGKELAEGQGLRPDQRGEKLLEVEGLKLRPRANPISFDLRRGEVLGIAGLVGSGRTRLLRSIAGASAPLAGEMRLDGKRVRWPTSPRDALHEGIALLPEDRKTQGLVLSMTIADNITATALSKVARLGFVSRSAQHEMAARLMRELALNRTVGDFPVVNLSGGGQQKVAFSRALFANPAVLLADEPTRGVDVSSKVDLLQAIRTFADRGGAVIMTSAEIEEVLDVSDRVLVLRDGGAVAEYDVRASQPTMREVLDNAFGEAVSDRS